MLRKYLTDYYKDILNDGTYKLYSRGKKENFEKYYSNEVNILSRYDNSLKSNLVKKYRSLRDLSQNKDNSLKNLKLYLRYTGILDTAGNTRYKKIISDYYDNKTKNTEKEFRSENSSLANDYQNLLDDNYRSYIVNDRKADSSTDRITENMVFATYDSDNDTFMVNKEKYGLSDGYIFSDKDKNFAEVIDKTGFDGYDDKKIPENMVIKLRKDSQGIVIRKNNRWYNAIKID